MTDLPAPLGFLDGQTHNLPLRVYYEDTDAGGVVYHASYVRFLERGRTDFLLFGGVSNRSLLELDSPVFFAVRRLEMDFLGPARLEDSLTVRSVFAEGGGARLEMEQDIVCNARRILHARLDIVCVTPAGRPVRPPKVLVQALAPYRGGVLKST